jgi:hypothetical protein
MIVGFAEGSGRENRGNRCQYEHLRSRSFMAAFAGLRSIQCLSGR